MEREKAAHHTDFDCSLILFTSSKLVGRLWPRLSVNQSRAARPARAAVPPKMKRGVLGLKDPWNEYFKNTLNYNTTLRIT